MTDISERIRGRFSEPYYRFRWPIRKDRVKTGTRRLHGVRPSMFMSCDSSRHEWYVARRPKKTGKYN